MHLLRRRPVAIVYWLLGIALAAWTGVQVSTYAGSSAAPERTADAEATTNGAQIAYGVIGFALGFFGVIALLAAVWMLAWARERRSQRDDDRYDRADDDAAGDSDLDDLLADRD